MMLKLTERIHVVAQHDDAISLVFNGHVGVFSVQGVAGLIPLVKHTRQTCVSYLGHPVTHQYVGGLDIPACETL